MQSNHLKSTHFVDYLNPSQIVFNLKATEKIEAFEELLDVLLKQDLIQNKKPILTRIIDRESLETTAIGNGVALPHARIDTGMDLAAVVGLSKKGIDFDAIDGKKVYFIILLIWNPSIPGLFNHLFAGLAQFLRREDFRERLFKAKNKTELYKVLSEIELNLPKPEEKIMSRASLLWKLQDIEIKMRKANKTKKAELKKKAALRPRSADIQKIEKRCRREAIAGKRR